MRLPASVNRSELPSIMDAKALESRCRPFSMAAGWTDIMSSLQGVRNRALKSSWSPRYGDGSEAGEYFGRAC